MLFVFMQLLNKAASLSRKYLRGLFRLYLAIGDNMNEALNNIIGVIVIIILCLMVLTVLVIAISILLDSIREWKNYKKHEMPKKWR